MSTATTTQFPGLHGMMVEFDREDLLVQAAQKIHGLGYHRLDAYTPFPIAGLTDAIGVRRTKMPLIVLCGGILGMFAGFGMQTYSAIIDYPLNIGGRPYYSWPAFIPITFECTILGAALSAVFGMIALNGLPQPYHPTFNVPAFAKASQNSFFLCVEATDPKFSLATTRQDLETLAGAKAVYEVPD